MFGLLILVSLSVVGTVMGGIDQAIGQVLEDGKCSPKYTEAQQMAYINCVKKANPALHGAMIQSLGGSCSSTLPSGSTNPAVALCNVVGTPAANSVYQCMNGEVRQVVMGNLPGAYQVINQCNKNMNVMQLAGVVMGK